LHDAQDKRVFDSVIVITDRRVLDKQLQDTIYQFEHKQGVVQKIDEDSTQLADSLKSGTPIVITTLQKFPFVTEKVGDLPGRRYAVIIDEAHSSQSGEAATELKGVLASEAIKKEAKEEAEAKGLPDYEEEILKTLAKGMVVTSSRLHAVRYKQEFDRQITEKGYKDVKTLVAFSGTVVDPDVPDVTYTEPDMNRDKNGKPIKERELAERFDTDEYQLLLVAEKYQTGFDQPLLHTMYVDKRLDGVQAVQTLSRLNRTATGKEDTFVLDFVNKAEDIQEAFKPYYEQTLAGEKCEPAQLYELQGKLNGMQVYHQQEVQDFCKVFFKSKANQTPADHAAMNAFLDPAVTRFNALGEEQQEEFRGLLTAFRNLYSFLSQVIPFSDSDLEKLFTFVRFLLTKLPRRNTGPQYDFDDDVTLKFYRLQKISEGSITLSPGEAGVVTGPTAVGTGKNEDPTVELSRLIDIINDKFGTDFKPADELFFNQIREEAVASEELVQAANANTKENFRFVFQKALEGLFIDRMEQNEELFAKYMNDAPFRKLVDEHLLTQVYEQIREQVQPAAG
jgi:type I restriction enzyme R subunit